MESVGELGKLKNKYENKRIFILGNGPSLNDTPLEKLDSEYTLALTQIGRLYSSTEWRPSFYYNPLAPSSSLTPTNSNIILENCTNDTICFLHSDWATKSILGDDVFYINTWDLFGSPFDELTQNHIKQLSINHLDKFWSANIEDIVYHYHSMYGAVQLAAYLGFDEIYFVGCDFGMEYDNPHMIFNSGLDPFRYDGGKYSYLRDAFRNGTVVQSLANAAAMKLILSFDTSSLHRIFDSDRGDHFTADYFDEIVIQDGERHENEIRKGHLVAKRICEADGIEMYNATLGGELEVYDRVELSAVLKD